MIEQSTELRLGIACDGDALEVVITDSAGAVSSARTLPSSGDFDQDLDLALRDTPASVRAIMLATDRLAAALHGDAKPARVGTLRIGGPVTDGVPVLASWPESLLRRISPVTAIVDGVVDGSGTELVPLDERAAAAYFTSCRGKVDA